MITEDYVSFETAKLLKERGFDVETEHKMWYVIKQFSTGCHWNSCTYKVGDITREYDKDCCIPMPTLQMAMKWLREVHKLHIEPHIQSYKNYNGNIYNLDGELLLGFTGESPEQSCEVAIKYCLEYLI